MSNLQDIYYKSKRIIVSYLVRRKIDVSDISIISMNCIGGIIYHDCGQRFLSPTINLFFEPSDFIKFVNNLDYYLDVVPEVSMGEEYPIGFLKDIKIYFMHYDTPEEALEKWEERKKRINRDKIFVIMVERDGFTKEDFENFKKIEYPKILFAKTKEYKDKDVVYFERYKNMEQLPDIIPGRYIYETGKLIDSISSLNL